MAKKTKMMVAYVSDAEVVVGPLSSEGELLEHCFLLRARKKREFERSVLPMEDFSDMISKAKDLLETRTSTKKAS